MWKLSTARQLPSPRGRLRRADLLRDDQTECEPSRWCGALCDAAESGCSGTTSESGRCSVSFVVRLRIGFESASRPRRPIQTALAAPIRAHSDSFRGARVRSPESGVASRGARGDSEPSDKISVSAARLGEPNELTDWIIIFVLVPVPLASAFLSPQLRSAPMPRADLNDHPYCARRSQSSLRRARHIVSPLGCFVRFVRFVRLVRRTKRTNGVQQLNDKSYSNSISHEGRQVTRGAIHTAAKRCECGSEGGAGR